MPNSRYSGYQYETSPRKIKPEYEPQQKKKNSNKTGNNNKVIKVFLSRNIDLSSFFIVIKISLIIYPHPLRQKKPLSNYFSLFSLIYSLLYPTS